MPATQVGVFRNHANFLEDSNGNGIYDAGVDRFIQGFTGPDGYKAGDIPVTGDWDGSGVAKVGIYRSSRGVWYLDANNNGIYDSGDYTYQFGGLTAGGNVDIPVVGDWTGIGKDCIGIYRSNGSLWLLDLNCNGTFDNTPADAFFPFGGLSGDVPVVGKWVGGATRVGVVRKYAPNGVPIGNPFYWVLDAGAANAGNTPGNHPPDCGGGTSLNRCFAFGGLTGDVFVSGDWFGTGVSGAGVYRQGHWLLDAALPGEPQVEHGNPTTEIFTPYGGDPSDIPVSGHWNAVVPKTSLALPSTGMKGVEYFPRGHAWWDMLYHWYTRDCSTTTLTQAECLANDPANQTVGQVVKADLATLAANGFNFVHLYVWDQDQANLFFTVPGPPPNTFLPLVPANSHLPGFASLENGGPQASGGLDANGNWAAGLQWNALREFVAAAAAQHLYVVINFATLWPRITYNLPGASYVAVGNSYGSWVGQFVGNLPANNTSCPGPSYGCYNIPVWGINYGIDLPANSNPSDPIGQFWHAAYRNILGQVSQNVYPSGSWFQSGRALLGVDPILQGPAGPISPQLGGSASQAPYQWFWQGAQSVLYNLRTQVGAPLGGAPDVYLLELWNPNAADLARSLKCLAGQPDAQICPTTPVLSCNGPCDTVPFQKILVTEMADSTSFEAFPFGNGAVSYGDSQEPTTNNAGQKQWLTDTLCMFSNLGIYNFAWFGLYDAYSWYEAHTSNTPAGYAWGGFWGLRPEVSGFGDKPAWNAMIGFNSLNPSGCSTPANPALALQADAAYYTAGDTAQLTYTASNATSLSLAAPAQPPPGQPAFASFDCEAGPSNELSGSALLGSCAYTNAQLTAMTNSVTLNGQDQPANGGVSSTSTSISVAVGLSPIINGLVNCGPNGTSCATGQSCNFAANPNCMLDAGQSDILEIFGEGFAINGGDKVKLTSGAGTWWLYSGDGTYFWDGNGQRGQINAQLYCSVIPGIWTIQVVNPNSSTASPGYLINVLRSSGCP